VGEPIAPLAIVAISRAPEARILDDIRGRAIGADPRAPGARIVERNRPAGTSAIAPAAHHPYPAQLTFALRQGR
jgi:hypothetical protein